jgi:hypothetical protein
VSVVEFIYTRCTTARSTLGSVFERCNASPRRDRRRAPSIAEHLDLARDDAAAVAAYRPFWHRGLVGGSRRAGKPAHAAANVWVLDSGHGRQTWWRIRQLYLISSRGEIVGVSTPTTPGELLYMTGLANQRK